jgi:D-alanyl-D-alanine dipeptidase
MLIAASQKLPDSLRVVVWDAWRPIRVQRTLFDKYLTILRQEYPDMNEKDLAARASVFVALPSDDVRCPSPHNTGGAVDVSIIKENGEYLEMGTDFDDFSPSAHTRYFENIVLNDAVSSKELVYLQNRRLLYFAMTSVGFANYPEEWWHYDYGNQFWASVLGQPVAIYGSAHLPVKQ